MSTLFGINAQIDLGNAAVGIATFVVAMVSLWVSRQSIFIANKNHYLLLKSSHSQKISDYRRDWIENLRNELAEFLRSHSLLSTKYGKNFLMSVIREVGSGKDNSELSSIVKNMNYISLMLNLNEDDHKKLDTMIKSVMTSESEYTIGQISEQARLILKKEWDRLKQLTLESETERT